MIDLLATEREAYMLTTTRLLSAQKFEISEAALGYLACALGTCDAERVESCTVYQFEIDDVQHAIDAVGTIYANFPTAFEQQGYSPEQVGYDLWLTRNRHGVGFADRGLGELGTELQRYVGNMGSVEVDIEADGTPYFT